MAERSFDIATAIANTAVFALMQRAVLQLKSSDEERIGGETFASTCRIIAAHFHQACQKLAGNGRIDVVTLLEKTQAIFTAMPDWARLQPEITLGEAKAEATRRLHLRMEFTDKPTEQAAVKLVEAITEGVFRQAQPSRSPR